MIIVDIQDLQEMLDIDADLIGDWAQKTLMYLNMENAELSVVLTDDSHIRELNRTYLDRDRPTNVISFPQQEGEGPSGEHLGDIVISVERAADEADGSGMNTMERLMQLLVHGICHLIGYDHEGVSEEKSREMEDAQDQILNYLRTDV